jgi:hypothetical protein
MAQAEDHPSGAGTASQMTSAEMSALASRLRARGNSVLMRDQPEQANDLKAAAALVDRLVVTEQHLREALGPPATPPSPEQNDDQIRQLVRRLRARAEQVPDRPDKQRDTQAAASNLEWLCELLADIRRLAEETTDETTELHLRGLIGGAQ